MNRRIGYTSAMLLMTVTAVTAVAAVAQSTKSTGPWGDYAQLVSGPKQVTKAPAADFGMAAAACAGALKPGGLDVTQLPAIWTSLPLGGKPDTKNFAFERAGSPVKIYLSTTFSAGGHCVVDGYGTSKGQFGAIAGAVKKQVGVALGTKLEDTGSNGDSYSRGQGYRSGDMMIIISSENYPEGMNVRVTLTRIDPTKSAFELANSAGMAAEFLPSMLATAAAPAPTAPAAAQPTPHN